ncbi:MAG: AbiV family abortive infection protein [Lutibacter sp.]|nr:AbiV family abortive infection protein [Lutibacter sp.]
MNKEEYFVGVRKSLVNATDLFDDAEILLNQKRYPRAYTLFQFAIEEIGKASMIFEFLLNTDYENKIEQNKFKKKFIDHKSKIESSIGIDLLLAFSIPNQKLKSKLIHNVNRQQNKINELNNLKNSSLYTDIVNDRFILPNELINEKMVSEIQFISNLRLKSAKQIYEIALGNFDKLHEDYKNINEDEMINNPPEEILQLIKLKTGIVIIK